MKREQLDLTLEAITHQQQQQRGNELSIKRAGLPMCDDESLGDLSALRDI